MSNWDYWNRDHSRNVDNTNTGTYNCGGYALDTFSWFTPYYDGDDDSYDDNDNEMVYSDFYRCELINDYLDEYSIDETEAMIARMDCQYILDHFPNLVEITNPSEEDLKNIILYRMYIKINDEDGFVDTDFHFRRVIDGICYEKSGGCSIHACDIELHQPWKIADDIIYDSEIHYFREKI